MIIIETNRLLIKQVEQSDFDNLYAICSDKELMKFVGNGKPLSKKQTQKWIDVTISNYAVKGFGMYGVIYKPTNQFIGYCGLVYSKDINDNELIYALTKEFWGQGLATEMTKQVVQFGFNTLKLNMIFASIDPNNVASEKILLKIGFQEVFKQNDEFGLTTTYFSIQPFSIRLLGKSEKIPYNLLLLADETKEAIDKYIHNSEIYVCEQNGQVTAGYALNLVDNNNAEIKNIAVEPRFQGRGMGTFLLEHATQIARKKGLKSLLIGTADTGERQIKLYQKAGFEKQSIIKDFFIDNYPKPIFENGRQLKDFVILRKDIRL